MAGPRISRAAKAKARQRLGSLKHRRVHEKTAMIYTAALALFSAWLQCEGQPLPKHESELDPILCAYAEVLWQEGESKQDLANVLSALEFEEGSLRYHLRCAWRLYGAWKKSELQQQCTPMLVKWCRAVAGAALARGWPEEAFLFLLAFDCLLRSVEAATLCAINLEINEAATMGTVCLSASKGQTRSGIKEMVTISDPTLIRWAKALKELKRPGDPLMVGGSKALRRKFKTCVEDVGLRLLLPLWHTLCQPLARRRSRMVATSTTTGAAPMQHHTPNTGVAGHYCHNEHRLSHPHHSCRQR